MLHKYSNANSVDTACLDNKNSCSEVMIEAIRIPSSADPGGDRGSRPPLENHKLYGFLQGISNWTPVEKVGPPPPEKCWTLFDRFL